MYNFTTEEKIYQIISLITAQIRDLKTTPTETIMNQLVDEANNALFKLDQQAIQNVKRELLTRNAIYMDLAMTLSKSEHTMWYTNERSEPGRYWLRYREYLNNEQGFAYNIINSLDESLNEIINHLGDPLVDGRYSRKGLVVGDVQSGKTSTYIGLIAKAADAGYRIFILLTGTIEDLRRQTQDRVDFGFIGRRSAEIFRTKEIANSRDLLVGVGLINPTPSPICLTSTELDFRKENAKNLNFQLKSFSEPVVFVVKKNKTVLTNLNKWLKEQNADYRGKIDAPMILIDDESDYASVNTKSEEEYPAVSNNLIRRLKSLFYKTNYIGFTATPFANIFIDPRTREEMENEDLFPSDFITLLSPPSNYIGIDSVFYEDGAYESQVRIINDLFDYIPEKHNKSQRISKLAPSLKEAIRTFMIANTIIDLDNSGVLHRSMLVNISRFTMVQNRLASEIAEYVEELKTVIQVFSGFQPEHAAYQSDEIKYLYETWKSEYATSSISWESVLGKLNESVSPIEVRIVNSSTGKTGEPQLNYISSKNGLRVIVVGGTSLSRGLTLEGLIVSYFCRNSRMYDTLLQMGRWFGYRRHYANMFRIWIPKQLKIAFCEIGEAIDELKSEIRIMKAQGKTPTEFGLKVRTSTDTLLITAPNKMRVATDYIQTVSLSMAVVETPFLSANENTNKENREIILNALYEHNVFNMPMVNRAFKNVPKECVMHIIEKFNIPYLNLKFNSDGLKDFISQSIRLEKWDIAFVSGDEEEKFYITENYHINPVTRDYELRDNVLWVSKGHRRLGGTGDTKYGLERNEIRDAELAYQNDNPMNIDRDKKKGINQKAYLRYLPNRNPLLMIYVIKLKKNDNSCDIELTKRHYFGLGIAIPKLDDSPSTFAKYKINYTLYKQLAGLDYEEGDE